MVNSNPATIMTDKEIADKVYIRPITLEFVARILRKERQMLCFNSWSKQGLIWPWNCLKAVYYGSGRTSRDKLSAIDQAEDRDLFKQLMEELKQPIPESGVNTVEKQFCLCCDDCMPSYRRHALHCGGMVVVACVPTRKNCVKSLKMV